jgi:hypothetical protein
VETHPQLNFLCSSTFVRSPFRSHEHPLTHAAATQPLRIPAAYSLSDLHSR